MDLKEGLAFDDVLLVPQASGVLPYEVNLETFITAKIKIDIPIISAAMDMVTQSGLAIALGKVGGFGVIHRAQDISSQANEVLKAKKEGVQVGAAVGVGEDSLKRAEALLEAGVDVLFVDTAHGHSLKVVKKVAQFRKLFKDAQIVAGNIVTQDAARDLISAGTDGLKVGVGPGSICTTRVVAGVGVPQVTATVDVYNEAKRHDIPVITDGGLRYSGDIVKALASGASAVMLGSLLAETEEAPGEIMEHNGVKFKKYRGMGSLGVMGGNGKSNDRYFQKAVEVSKIIPEGIEGEVPLKGKLEDVVYQLIGGVRSGLGYCGAKDIEELHQKARFIKVSKAGVVESHPHDIFYIKDAPNYKR